MDSLIQNIEFNPNHYQIKTEPSVNNSTNKVNYDSILEEKKETEQDNEDLLQLEISVIPEKNPNRVKDLLHKSQNAKKMLE